MAGWLISIVRLKVYEEQSAAVSFQILFLHFDSARSSLDPRVCVFRHYDSVEYTCFGFVTQPDPRVGVFRHYDSVEYTCFGFVIPTRS
ncbi:hypothetical protein RRG08_022460 [Elysia crispata]|uniref:Uncharacterized protein n=1 Tax=Elysia crispata TaxID=231223 RepID=A0AAE1D871_9GAST|nr:hypothetical protein RRG08_022460 [Elysia crispata]